MNYISISVYFLLALSLAIGIKIAPRRGFNQNFLSLDATNCLKGVMAIFVLMHHLSQKKLFQQTHTIPFFEQIGFLFVGVFFLTSGYGLYKSFLTKKDYLNTFLKRRILPLVLSYYVMVIIYAAYHLINKSNFTPAEWIFKLSGLVAINSQSWFVPVIILMYLSFYFIYKNERLRKIGIPLLLLITFLQGLLFCIINHFPWYIGESGWWKQPGAFSNLPWWMRHCALPFEGEWWVNSTIGFVLGIAVAKHEKALIEWSSKKYWPKFILIILLTSLLTFAGFFCCWNISYWTEFGGNLGTMNKLICYLVQCLQVLVTDIFILFLMRKVYVQNSFYRFCGERSLEIYLMQETALFGWLFLIEKDRQPLIKSGNWNLILYMILVTATVMLSAIIYHSLNKAIKKTIS